MQIPLEKTRNVAYKRHYLRNCYRKYRREQRPITYYYQVIFNYVRERLIEGGEIIYKKYLVDADNNISLPLEFQAVTDARPIIEKILKKLGDISLHKPIYGKQFFYKESLSKGQMIIHYIKKL